VRFIVNGADVMNPGIVSADPEIEAGDLVIVAEERHKKPLAVGKALIPGKDIAWRGKGHQVPSSRRRSDLGRT